MDNFNKETGIVLEIQLETALIYGTVIGNSVVLGYFCYPEYSGFHTCS